MKFKEWLESTNNLIGPSGSPVVYYFKTAQGSQYILTDKNESRRIKSFHINTGGEDQGLHDWFENCVFVPPNYEIQANSFGFTKDNNKGSIMLGASNNKLTFFMIKDNKWSPVLYSDAFKKSMKHPQHRHRAQEVMEFEYTKQPIVGFSVAEWTNKSDNTIYSYHFGSPVSEIKRIQDVNPVELQGFFDSSAKQNSLQPNTQPQPQPQPQPQKFSISELEKKLGLQQGSLSVEKSNRNQSLVFVRNKMTGASQSTQATPEAIEFAAKKVFSLI